MPNKRIIVAMVGMLAWVSPVSAQQLGGMAEAVDGDTLDFTGTRIRLAGIDAPELGQTCERAGETWACGAEARSRLAELLAGHEIDCLIVDDTAEVPLANCTADGLDLADSMIRYGHAVAVPMAHADLAGAEEIAKRYALGLWSGTFTIPAEYRAANPTPKLQPRPAQQPRRAAAATWQASPAVYRDTLGRCAIKGNRSYRGDWIYYLPGQNYYDATRPEARFCTEADALQAGYRPSRGG